MQSKSLIWGWRVSTGLLSALMLYSASMYFMHTEAIRQAFTFFGYPDYLVYPLAWAKILGVVALWLPKKIHLKDWAYAGFFFDLVLAFTAHQVAQDGGSSFSLAGLVFIVVSYVTHRLLLKRPTK